jgi:hypothetical protein
VGLGVGVRVGEVAALPEAWLAIGVEAGLSEADPLEVPLYAVESPLPLPATEVSQAAAKAARAARPLHRSKSLRLHLLSSIAFIAIVVRS